MKHGFSYQRALVCRPGRHINDHQVSLYMKSRCKSLPLRLSIGIAPRPQRAAHLRRHAGRFIKVTYHGCGIRSAQVDGVLKMAVNAEALANNCEPRAQPYSPQVVKA